MSEKRRYTDFDLPTNHLPGNQHFIPPKARDSDEIARRRELRPGTLLAEYQVRGLGMAAIILENVQEVEDVKFASKVLAVSGINSAWYSFARGYEHQVMRRRLKLPVLATDNGEAELSVAEFLPNSHEALQKAALEAHMLVGANQNLPAKIEQYKKQIGRSLGGVSLALACLASPEGLQEATQSDGFEAQNFARRRGLWALHHSRTLATQLGSYPSIAGLADRDSDLSVYWRRNAPDGALEAYEQALESPMAA